METTKKNSAFGPKQIGMIIFTGVLMLLSSCFVGGQTNTVLPALSEVRGWDNNLLNVVSGLASLLDGIGIIIFARLARKNTKKMTGIALIIMAVCLVLFGMVQNLALFFVLMFIMGACSGCFSSTCSMVLTSNWWPTKKGVVLGFSTMGVILMQVVYAPVMPKAYAAIGIANTQIVLAVLTIIVAIISFTLVKDTPEEAGTTPDGMEGLELEETTKLIEELHNYKSPFTLGKLAKDPSSWTMALGTGLPLMVAMTYIASTIPALLSYGYEFPFASFVFAIGGIAALAGSFIFGVIDQKIGTKKATLIYIIIMFIAVFAAMNMSKSIACVWISAIVLMAANGSARNLIPSFVGTRYGRWDYPAAYSLIGTIAMLGGGLGIMVTGFFTSYTHMYIFDIVILVIALICCLATKDNFIGKRG
ncbi:MAG: MFS transporter [Eubacterium sp.]|jgi:OFA family oxalate/formate antiporter-like MFS transporter|nr:MFS transporter [Eubacterium sp.]